MGGAVLIGLLVLPLVELFVIIKVAEAIGALLTVVLLVGTSFVGGAIVRRAGARAWESLRSATATGGAPPRDVVDGAIMLLGGVLLVIPGFVTDAIGLLLVLPFTRRLARWAVAGFVLRRVRVLRRAGPGRRSGDGDVIDGEVVDEEPGDKRDRPGQIGRAG
jgi:UPF0716 protein FxsA